MKERKARKTAREKNDGKEDRVRGKFINGGEKVNPQLSG